MPKTLYKTIESERELMALYDSILARWPVPYTTRYVLTRYGKTFVIDSGDKSLPVLVLIHGTSSNAVSWVSEVEDYSKYFRVIAVDVIGDPGKSSMARPPWRGEAYSEWFADVLKNLAIKKAILMGISQGGWIATKYASVYPQSVSKLVLISPAGIVPTKTSFIAVAVICSLLGKWGANKLNHYIFGNRPIDPVALKFLNFILVNFKQRFDEEYIFTEAELRKVIMPVLLLGGEKDVVRSVESIDLKLKRLLPNLSSIILPEYGHAVTGVSKLVLPFLLKD